MYPHKFHSFSLDRITSARLQFYQEKDSSLGSDSGSTRLTQIHQLWIEAQQELIRC